MQQSDPILLPRVIGAGKDQERAIMNDYALVERAQQANACAPSKLSSPLEGRV